MGEIKLTGPSMEQRIHNRLRNSGAGANPDVSVQKGSSPTRTFHNIHHSASQGGMNKNPGMAKGKDILSDFGGGRK